MPEENGKPPEGFTVVDRRTSSQPEPAPEGAPPAEPAAPAGGAAAPPPGESAAAPKDRPRAAPPIDFTTFVLSLASTAAMQLGATPDPETGKTATDPVLARQTIDILGMLREKTRGNLTDEETRFFDALLYDLRMRYLEVAGRGP